MNLDKSIYKLNETFKYPVPHLRTAIHSNGPYNTGEYIDYKEYPISKFYNYDPQKFIEGDGLITSNSVQKLNINTFKY